MLIEKMELKELLKKVGNTEFSYKTQKTPTLAQLGITETKVGLIDTWAKGTITYGMLATYIPELKKVDKELTAIAVGDLHGNEIIAGTGTRVSVTAQSTIK